MLSGVELIVLEEKRALLARHTGVAAYDFDFRLHFACRHPYRLDSELDAILRIGAAEDDAAYYAEAAAIGLAPINDLQQHPLAGVIEAYG
jgi:hypothetical protein